jgi:hypothetical protein
MLQVRDRSGVGRASWADRRGGDRLPTGITAKVRGARGISRVTADVLDLSVTGCRICTWSLTEGDDVWIAIGQLSPAKAKVVWVHEGFAGIQFVGQLHPSVVTHIAKM